MPTPNRKSWYERNRALQKAASKATREALIAAGLCETCRKPSEGTKRCATCNAARNRRRKTLRVARTRGGSCTRCGNSQDEAGKTRCRSCRQATQLEEQERREKYRVAGQCTLCGEPAVGSGCILCQTCYLKRTARTHFGSSRAWEVLLGIYLRQARLCVYTGWPLVLGINTELDHRIPKARGGDDHPDNLQWTHATANRMKNCMDEDEFILLVRAIANNTANREIVP